MFRRYKKDEGAPNRLHDEAEPNKLSWTSADGEDADLGGVRRSSRTSSKMSDEDGDDEA
jgi:hypothetical protein